MREYPGFADVRVSGRTRPPRVAALACLGIFLSWAATGHAGTRLNSIRDRGHLICGVMPQVPGFASVDSNGQYSGFEIDMCRALSAAIFGVPDRARFAMATSVRQFSADSPIDVVARRLTVTLSREARNGLLFGPIIFFDGAGFLVRAGQGWRDPQQLASQPICVRESSEAEQALVAYFEAAGLPLASRRFDGLAAAAAAFFAGICTALTADVSELGGVLGSRAGREDFVILPKMISKEPLALLVREDDPEFLRVVRWTIFALIEAEELGVSSTNIDARLRRGGRDVQGLLGTQTGPALGLDQGWVVNVIRSVGNYGEIFARHLGADSPIKLERGPNRLWTAGGLLYAPPVR